MAQARAQDDFFQYVNGDWIKKNPIPPEESRWGAFIVLRHTVEKRLKKLIQKTSDQRIRDLYRSGMDMKTRNRLGATPLAPLFEEIASITTRQDLVKVIAHLERAGMGVPWHVIVDQDAKESTRYILYLDQGGLGMPDRDYYLKETPEEKRVRTAYRVHIVKLFALLGNSPKVANKKMETVMRIETRLARASMDKVSMRDPHKVYHKKTVTGLKRYAPHILWKDYFALIGAAKTRTLILSQPAFIKEADRMVATMPLADWKVYLTFHVVNDAASALSEEFVETAFAFYGRTLSGQKEIKPLWRRTLASVNGALGEAVGKRYVAQYFPPAAKKRMEILVRDLTHSFEKRIKALSWMSAATKRKALQKLKAINCKIGYPSRWRSYKGLTIRPDDYVGNLLRADEHEHRRQMKKIGKAIERHEWFMTPQTVNAYYSPTMNEIVFPAAILEPPFFGFMADDADNYGSIGAVIGHELTHGFDDQGAKFAGDGNLKTWWTAADKKRFEAKSRVLATQFDEYEVLPGIRVNGKLTLGENIADLGGLAISYDAYQERLKKTRRRILRGRTPEERFFMSYAVSWREHMRPEFLKTMVAVNPHSPDHLRTNGPVSNFAEFYAAFNVAKGDKLWRPVSERAAIW